MASDVITVFKGEKKNLQFTVTDSSGVGVDCRTATKELDAFNSAGIHPIDKGNTDFVVSGTAFNVLTVLCDFDIAIGQYFLLLKVTWASSNIVDKSVFILKVEDATVPVAVP